MKLFHSGRIYTEPYNPRMTLYLLVAVLFLCSCGPKEIFLQTEELKRIDSLFITSRKEWTLQLADSCEAYREVHFQPIVDSLMEARMAEIRQILELNE